jgi:hypothetical protein
MRDRDNRRERDRDSERGRHSVQNVRWYPIKHEIWDGCDVHLYFGHAETMPATTFAD